MTATSETEITETMSIAARNGRTSSGAGWSRAREGSETDCSVDVSIIAQGRPGDGSRWPMITVFFAADSSLETTRRFGFLLFRFFLAPGFMVKLVWVFADQWVNETKVDIRCWQATSMKKRKKRVGDKLEGSILCLQYVGRPFFPAL